MALNTPPNGAAADNALESPDTRNVHFHFTPTHGSWLNQVEVWFSILKRAALDGASHASPGQVRNGIDRFVAAYNETATPFEWQKREVRQVNSSHHYADLRN